MKTIIEGMWGDSLNVALEEYHPPENPECFGLWVNLRIGSDAEEGTNDFRLLVCTPGWLEVMLRYEWGRAQWGRHMLIVLEYDFDLIKNKIVSYVESCTGNDFLEIAQKISKVASWEFEGYQL